MKLSYQEQLAHARGAVDVYRELEHERIVKGPCDADTLLAHVRGWRLALQSILAEILLRARDRGWPGQDVVEVSRHFIAILQATEDRFARRVRECRVTSCGNLNEMAHDQNFGWAVIGLSLVDAFERLVPPKGDGRS